MLRPAKTCRIRKGLCLFKKDSAQNSTFVSKTAHIKKFGLSWRKKSPSQPKIYFLVAIVSKP